MAELQNPAWAQHYDASRFSILAQCCSPFHLPALEATFIKTSNSAKKKKNLCIAKRLYTNDALSLVFSQPITT